LKASLESILNQLDERFEIIVVDSCSDDGSLSILEDYEKAGRIRLIVRKCTRGTGRQIAFDNANGEYIISNLDTDDIFNPCLNDVLNIYRNSCDGMMLRLVSPKDIGRWHGNFANTIAPAELIRGLGGYADVQFGEDIDLWCRAAEKGKYRWARFNLVQSTFEHEDRSLLNLIQTRWSINRDFRRLGLTINAGTFPSKILKLFSSMRYSPGPSSSKFRTDFSRFGSETYQLSEKYHLQLEQSDYQDNKLHTSNGKLMKN